MQDNKGFTLVELLVVIVILGIVTGISIPLIRNIQENNTKKRYTIYADSLKRSAKLYTDSFAEDLFGHRRSGCAFVSYTTLKEKGLSKDIGIDKVSCDSDSTFVKIVKLENKYTYTVYMGCGEIGSNQRVNNITISYPEEGKVYEMDSNNCRGPLGSTLSITAPAINEYKKFHVINLSISSLTGIGDSNNIYVAWRKDKEFSSIPLSDWRPVYLSAVGNQKSRVENGETITTNSQNFRTPENETGEYYLLVKVDRLVDLYGESWKNPQQPGYNYIWFGPYKIDNTPPTCSTQKISGVGSTGGVTVKVLCEDSDSQCMEESHNYSQQKSTKVYKVTDKAGNEGECSATISSESCNPYDCNPYRYKCGTYACGTNCRHWCWGNYGQTPGGNTGAYQWCCDEETVYCDRYCTGYNTCYQTCYK